jgi:hypothetical protein
MNSPTLIITILLSILIFFIRRKYFLFPFIAAACFVPADQRIIIMDLDFTILRLLVLAGALRLFIRNEYNIIQWNKFDKLLLLWAICGAVIYVVQWQNMRSIICACIGCSVRAFDRERISILFFRFSLCVHCLWFHLYYSSGQQAIILFLFSAAFPGKVW